MELILLERVNKLGQMGDTVNVKPGYGRNFLLPHKKALRATKENIEFFAQQKKHLEADNLKHKKEAEKVAKSMDKLSVTLIRQAGESGQLYGSVSSKDIAIQITEKGFAVKKQQVNLNMAIKTLGLYSVTVSLHPEVSQKITVNIARSEEEAMIQLESGEIMTAKDTQTADEKPKKEAKVESKKEDDEAARETQSEASEKTTE